jgi:hypothetical protein
MTNDTTTETVNEEHRCAAVPLVELLARVPETARHIYTEPDGLKATHFIPVGRYCREAAARIAELERDAARYRVLRRSVLQAPMSAGFANMTTESDIDAQCDQIAAIDSQRGG